MKLDQRYTITLEFHGYRQAHYVVRCCGYQIGRATTKLEAQRIQDEYEWKRRNPALDRIARWYRTNLT